MRTRQREPLGWRCEEHWSTVKKTVSSDNARVASDDSKCYSSSWKNLAERGWKSWPMWWSWRWLDYDDQVHHSGIQWGTGEQPHLWNLTRNKHTLSQKERKRRGGSNGGRCEMLDPIRSTRGQREIITFSFCSFFSKALFMSCYYYIKRSNCFATGLLHNGHWYSYDLFN